MIEATVLLDEEYGWKTWYWETEFSPAQLEAWWKALPSVNLSPENLPGTVRQIEEDLSDLEDAATLILCDEALSYEERERKALEIFKREPRRVFRFEDGTPIPERQPGWWTGHIHMEEDSWIKDPEGREVLHAGYTEE